MAITDRGQVVEVFFSGGEVNDIRAAPELTQDIIGCPVVGDRGYDGDAFRKLLISQNNEPVIPGRKNRKSPISYDEEKYKKRGQKELRIW